MQMFQSMSSRFYSSMSYIAILGLLLLGLVMKIGNGNENMKKFTILNIGAMHITFFIIMLNYLLFLGEEAMSANSFVEYYSGIFMMQIIMVCVLFSPKILKNKIEGYFND